MSSWKDTMMSPHEIDEARAKGFGWNNTPGKSLLETQAEITWPIAHKAGMKEVVDWVEEQEKSFVTYGGKHCMKVYLPEWTTFLKEKGLSDG